MPLLERTRTAHSASPSNARVQGRAHWLIAGSLVVISALWLGAGAIKSDTSTAEPMVGNSIASAKNAAADARGAATVEIEELRVTAPRLPTVDFTFEEPAMDVALGELELPARDWSKSDS